MFFDGAYASKRKVALGGSSKKDQDKQSFLDKQKNERERRQQDKQKLKSAITIQAFFRGRMGISRIKQAERLKWDQDIKNSVNSNTIFGLVRTLLFFYKAQNDSERLRILCNVILDNIIHGMLFIVECKIRNNFNFILNICRTCTKLFGLMC